MTGSPSLRTAAAAAAVLVLTAALPAEGPDGVGDRLYPAWGHTAYRVSAYDIALDYHGNDRPLDAVTGIEARARVTLRRFTLDFGRGQVRAVTVNGVPARFRTAQDHLDVVPAAKVPAGQVFRVSVTHTSDPRGPQAEGGWIRTPDGLAMANQADAAHLVFPCNDHPSDKALFTFRVTTPRDLVAVANGQPVGGRRDTPGGTVWTYRTTHPMATELAQVSIGRSAVLRAAGPDGVAIRDVVAADDRDRLAARLALTAGQLAWMERQVGRYPFATYGVLSIATTTGFELETQTLSLFERRVLTAPERAAAPLMVHELAHQWFGDSVTPATWSDLWLNEGHATWYEWRYRAEQHYGASLEEQAKAAYLQDNLVRAQDGPPAAPLPPQRGPLGIFRRNVYAGGALALYALRQEIGADAFGRLERAWVTAHRDGNASTADFVALAGRTAGRDLGPFLRAWLYGRTTPPMPGHPDWRPGPSAPVPAPPGKPA